MVFSSRAKNVSQKPRILNANIRDVKILWPSQWFAKKHTTWNMQLWPEQFHTNAIAFSASTSTQTSKILAIMRSASSCLESICSNSFSDTAANIRAQSSLFGESTTEIKNKIVSHRSRHLHPENSQRPQPKSLVEVIDEVLTLLKTPIEVGELTKGGR